MSTVWINALDSDAQTSCVLSTFWPHLDPSNTLSQIWRGGFIVGESAMAVLLELATLRRDVQPHSSRLSLLFRSHLLRLRSTMSILSVRLIPLESSHVFAEDVNGRLYTSGSAALGRNGVGDDTADRYTVRVFIAKVGMNFLTSPNTQPTLVTGDLSSVSVASALPSITSGFAIGNQQLMSLFGNNCDSTPQLLV